MAISFQFGRQEDSTFLVGAGEPAGQPWQDDLPGQRKSSRTRPQSTVVTSTVGAPPAYHSTRGRRDSRAYDGGPRGFNIAVATNVNEYAAGADLGLPRDGGFGQISTMFGSSAIRTISSAFRTPRIGEKSTVHRVVESADSGPFFHNHAISDLESAVASTERRLFSAASGKEWD